MLINESIHSSSNAAMRHEPRPRKRAANPISASSCTHTHPSVLRGQTTPHCWTRLKGSHYDGIFVQTLQTGTVSVFETSTYRDKNCISCTKANMSELTSIDLINKCPKVRNTRIAKCGEACTDVLAGYRVRSSGYVFLFLIPRSSTPCYIRLID